MAIAILLPLTAAYAIVITAVAVLLWRLGVPRQHAVVSGFLLYGVASGLLAALAWPLDSVMLPNAYAVLAGDWLYRSAIEWIGEPRSNQAHETIPWLLRVPQVYVLVSTVLCGVAGAAAQWLVNHWLDARGAATHGRIPRSGAAARPVN